MTAQPYILHVHHLILPKETPAGPNGRAGWWQGEDPGFPGSGAAGGLPVSASGTWQGGRTVGDCDGLVRGKYSSSG